MSCHVVITAIASPDPQDLLQDHVLCILSNVGQPCMLTLPQHSTSLPSIMSSISKHACLKHDVSLWTAVQGVCKITTTLTVKNNLMTSKRWWASLVKNGGHHPGQVGVASPTARRDGLLDPVPACYYKGEGGGNVSTGRHPTYLCILQDSNPGHTGVQAGALASSNSLPYMLLSGFATFIYLQQVVRTGTVNPGGCQDKIYQIFTRCVFPLGRSNVV